MSFTNTFSSFVRERPFKVIFWKFLCKLFKSKIPKFQNWKQLFENKAGIEIGGPSGIFSKNGFMPVYPYITSLAGVNFSKQTVWEGTIEEGNTYRYDDKKGHQFIAEGSDLKQIEDNSYDFLLSCNNLEHIANPIKALAEWKRVIKEGGALILILPRKESNFDHRRSITSLNHIINDYKNNVDESDLGALDEVLRDHDLSRDPHAGNYENFKTRTLNNLYTRTMHHHVFDIPLLTQLLSYIGMKTVITYSSPADHFIAALKTSRVDYFQD